MKNYYIVHKKSKPCMKSVDFPVCPISNGPSKIGKNCASDKLSKE